MYLSTMNQRTGEIAILMPEKIELKQKALITIKTYCV
jgi:hypothetical protein